MSTDFNEKGRHVQFMASKDEPPYYSILTPKVIDFANAIETEISKPQHKAIAVSTRGCFERFRGCMMCIWRMSEHENRIKEKAPTEIAKMVGITGAEIVFDFESLLFHSKGSLDRVAFFVSKQIYGQDCDKYTRFANVLGNFKEKNDHALQLINVITDSNPLFEGILFDIGTKKSLRSHVIHKSTASENARSWFTFHCIEPNKRIALDSILDDYAIFQTSQDLGKSLPFVILNALSLYLGMNRTLSLNDFTLKWETQMVDYRDYISECSDAIKFTIYNTYSSGFTLYPVSLNPEICKKAY